MLAKVIFRKEVRAGLKLYLEAFHSRVEHHLFFFFFVFVPLWRALVVSKHGLKHA